jgi:hypothetical protein
MAFAGRQNEQCARPDGLFLPITARKHTLTRQYDDIERRVLRQLEETRDQELSCSECFEQLSDAAASLGPRRPRHWR